MAHSLSKQVALAVMALALGLHVYEQYALATVFSLGWLAWSLTPYAICAVTLWRSETGMPALCGVLAGLLLDLDTHYAVFVHPTSSTAALALIFVPIWNTILICPTAMLIAWIIINRRRAASPRAP